MMVSIVTTVHGCPVSKNEMITTVDILILHHVCMKGVGDRLGLVPAIICKKYRIEYCISFARDYV
jgi:hypothetical protein